MLKGVLSLSSRFVKLLVQNINALESPSEPITVFKVKKKNNTFKPGFTAIRRSQLLLTDLYFQRLNCSMCEHPVWMSECGICSYEYLCWHWKEKWLKPATMSTICACSYNKNKPWHLFTGHSCLFKTTCPAIKVSCDLHSSLFDQQLNVALF